jgi:hypothetical protein
MDAVVPQDVRHLAYGQAVWSCPPDAGVKSIEMRFRPCGRNAVIGRRWRLTSPVLQGERGAAVKPLRRECRMFRPTCTDLWAPFLFSPQGLRVRPAPGIPCALCFEGAMVLCITRTQIAPRECERLFESWIRKAPRVRITSPRFAGRGRHRAK